MPKPKISRRGFRNAPTAVTDNAAPIVAQFALDFGATLAELRPASYCGPGSAGDRGAYMLSLHAAGGHHTLTVIERN